MIRLECADRFPRYQPPQWSRLVAVDLGNRARSAPSLTMAVPPPSKPERGSKLLPVRSSWLLEARLFGSGPPSGCAVYEVGASLLVSAADCSAGDSAACSAGGCSATGAADCGAAG